MYCATIYFQTLMQYYSPFSLRGTLNSLIYLNRDNNDNYWTTVITNKVYSSLFTLKI